MSCENCKLRKIIEDLLKAMSHIYDETEEEKIEDISIHALRQAEKDYDNFKGCV